MKKKIIIFIFVFNSLFYFIIFKNKGVFGFVERITADKLNLVKPSPDPDSGYLFRKGGNKRGRDEC